MIVYRVTGAYRVGAGRVVAVPAEDVARLVPAFVRVSGDKGPKGFVVVEAVRPFDRKPGQSVAFAGIDKTGRLEPVDGAAPSAPKVDLGRKRKAATKPKAEPKAAAEGDVEGDAATEPKAAADGDAEGDAATEPKAAADGDAEGDAEGDAATEPKADADGGEFAAPGAAA